MKSAAASFLVALASAAAPAMAQRAADPIDKPRACSSLSDAERAKCLDTLPRAIAQESARREASSSAESQATPDNWIFSETTSPIDYSPVVIASAISGGALDGSGLRLSIACRRENTSLTLTALAVLPPGERYTASYTIAGSSPTTLPVAAAPFGTGLVLGADVARLLASLPAQGEISFRIAGRQGTWEGRYSLTGLNATRKRLAASCRWPIEIGTARK